MLQELDVATMRVARGAYKATLVPTGRTARPDTCNSLSRLELCSIGPDRRTGFVPGTGFQGRNELRLLTTRCGGSRQYAVRVSAIRLTARWSTSQALAAAVAATTSGPPIDLVIDTTGDHLSVLTADGSSKHFS